ncbi:DUF922 domain-containing protein, partial [Aurantimonas sp. C2-4-R8]|nr:DUF922 domain-containing protein [Aurantimonas sp. C2-4-R8]
IVVSSFMAYRSFGRFWQASAPATIRRLLRPHHPFSAIAHEGRHISIAQDYRMRMELQLASLDPASTCQRLGQRVVETVESVKQRHLEAQTAFDASERQRSLALSFGR